MIKSSQKLIFLVFTLGLQICSTVEHSTNFCSQQVCLLYNYLPACFSQSGGALAQSVNEAVGSIPAVAVRSLLVGSVSV